MIHLVAVPHLGASPRLVGRSVGRASAGRTDRPQEGRKARVTDGQTGKAAGREREEHHKRPRKRVPACVASNRIKVLFSIRHLRPRLPELRQDPPPGKGGERNVTSGALVVRRTHMSFRQSGDENAEDIPQVGWLELSHQQVELPPRANLVLLCVRSFLPSLEGQFEEAGLHRAVAKRWLSSALSLSFLPFGEVSSGENVSVGGFKSR